VAWLYLFLAGLLEIGFTTFLKLSDGFGRLWPTAFFLLFALASFWLLNKSLQGVPLGTAYAVWTSVRSAPPSSAFCCSAIPSPRGACSFSPC
jgi:quaternary ammonium compound-resistance protein SugE